MPRIGMEPVRRKALIAAAIDAIHDRGMGQVTMGEIARRAGVSAALAHHYFGGKDQLLLATMRHLLARARRRDPGATLRGPKRRANDFPQSSAPISPRRSSVRPSSRPGLPSTCRRKTIRTRGDFCTSTQGDWRAICCMRFAL